MSITHQPLSCVEFDPQELPQYTLIWLHGLGADGNDFVPIIQPLRLENPPFRFVFPHAPIRPVTLNSGYPMRAWFDIKALDLSIKVNETEVAEITCQVRQLIENEEKKHISSDHVFLGGFSQGAAMALIAGLGYPKPLAGIIALSGFLPREHLNVLPLHSANHQTPLFIGHGTKDTIVPYSFGVETHEALKTAGIKTEWHRYEMAHSVCAEEINDISAFIHRCINQ